MCKVVISLIPCAHDSVSMPSWLEDTGSQHFCPSSCVYTSMIKPPESLHLYSGFGYVFLKGTSSLLRLILLNQDCWRDYSYLRFLVVIGKARITITI